MPIHFPLKHCTLVKSAVQMVFESGAICYLLHVLTYDAHPMQEEAVAATERRLQEYQSSSDVAMLKLHVGCHSQLRQMLAASGAGSPERGTAYSAYAVPLPAPRLICFNLGTAYGSSPFSVQFVV